ncbi:MAG: carboxypeptidase regulatory-like domain-containing protein [Candidatus Latescibacteria bacterium]|nr:carboxypeptidase regulatory-like domain-containing protein [Candidatus Latescibacterota bacterium]
MPIWAWMSLWLLIGCSSPTGSGRPTAVTTGAIVGTVATGGTDAIVEAQRADLTSRMARVDQAGRYTIEGLIPGSYRLVATARGYSRSSLGDPVAVLAGQTTTVQGLVLTWTGVGVPTGTLTGTVIGVATGQPIEGVYLQVACNPREIICLGRTAYTDENGRYTIPSIPPGFVFDLYVAKPGYPDRFVRGQVIGGNQTQTLDVRIGSP